MFFSWTGANDIFYLTATVQLYPLTPPPHWEGREVTCESWFQARKYGGRVTEVEGIIMEGQSAVTGERRSHNTYIHTRAPLFASSRNWSISVLGILYFLFIYNPHVPILLYLKWQNHKNKCSSLLSRFSYFAYDIIIININKYMYCHH